MMRALRFLFSIFLFSLFFWACSASKENIAQQKEKPVRIANDSLSYEIIIIDPGFTAFLNSIARPVGYYSQSYLENWNQIYVTHWNYRFGNPLLFNEQIYQNFIDYQPNINYGMEVNYKLFNYFQFAQVKYKINLENGTSITPRIR